MRKMHHQFHQDRHHLLLPGLQNRHWRNHRFRKEWQLHQQSFL
ncbi:MAG: hypothetical protein Q4P17_06680 [Methanobacterium sp.]|nr:hypothetical protein [Methanobacterium sp.]